ncbi:hypothetical protein SAMN04487996_111294 [Dyadobacter soli]|uniref:Uncharacterized protein n=2 Tax=Dyadobacter soli TaxID=659014 RepID=A0A1G7MJN3_9BACT|nr:hypothetical protein SAMN04487996_111294 [Dyadobacter soli]
MLFETLLSSPGMTDQVKLELKVSRQTALLLTTAVKAGLSAAKNENSLLSFAEASASAELNGVLDAILEKAGLTQTSKKLAALG